MLIEEVPAKEVPQLIKKTSGSQNFSFEVKNRLLIPVKIRKGDPVTIEASGFIALGLVAGGDPDGIEGYEGYSYFLSRSNTWSIASSH